MPIIEVAGPEVVALRTGPKMVHVPKGWAEVLAAEGRASWAGAGAPPKEAREALWAEEGGRRTMRPSGWPLR